MPENRKEHRYKIMQHENTMLRTPELLRIKNGSFSSFGANQGWYASWYRRIAGCGPTAASNLIWYLAATRPSLRKPLCPDDCTQQANMLRLMNQLWRYVTPGLNGVHKTSILIDGITRFAKERSVQLNALSLDIGEHLLASTTPEMIYGFLSDALASDLPVAFLNLSNGNIRNLESWHWVTLVSVDRALQAVIYDQGYRKDIDLALWLRTTTRGGGFVAIYPAV